LYRTEGVGMQWTTKDPHRTRSGLPLTVYDSSNRLTSSLLKKQNVNDKLL